uniref:Neurotrimin n=1 Tax=Nothobranchius kuhntae TaxID=321403 RepID=A0A1A8J135_NOTKU
MVTHTAWLNRSSILYAGEDKWSVDPRVSLVTLNQEQFTIKIENVDMTDEGQYVCAVQTSSQPKTTTVQLLVQVGSQGAGVFSTSHLKAAGVRQLEQVATTGPHGDKQAFTEELPVYRTCSFSL